jgi:hypothetical protein
MALTDKLTLSWKASSAVKTVERLAKETGLNLGCAPALGNEILLVHVKDVPVETVLDRIATATNGFWEIKESRRFLKPKQSQVEGENYEDRLRLILAAQKTWIEAAGRAVSDQELQKGALEYRKLQSEMEDSSVWERADFMDRWSKVSKLEPRNSGGFDLISRLDPRLLAKIKPGERMVFCPRPNSLQQPLPESISQAIAEYRRRNALWSRIANSPQEDNANAAEVDEESSEAGVSPGVPLVIVSRAIGEDPDSGFTVMFKPYDSSTKENSFAELEQEIAVIPEFQIEGSEDQPMSEALIPRESDRPYKLSEEATFMQRGGWFDKQPLTPEEDKRMMALMRKPTEIDPLSFATSEYLLQYFDETGENCVLNVPDAAAYLAQSWGEAETKVHRRLIDAFWKQVSMLTNWELTRADGWVDIKKKMNPGPTFAYLNSRVSRLDLDRAMESVEFFGRDSIVTRAAMARFEMRSASDLNPVSQKMMQFVLGKSFSEYGRDKQGLLFFGGLNLDQQKALLAGKSVSLSSLSESSKREFSLLVYGAEFSIVPRNQEPNAEEDDDSAEHYSSSPSWGVEPTVEIPGGVPAGTQIQFERVLTDKIEALRSPTDKSGWKTTVTNLASQAFYASRPDLFPWAAESTFSRYEYFRPYTSSDLKLVANLEGTSWRVKRWIHESSKSLNEKPVRRDQLPEQLLAKWNAVIKEMETEYKDVKPGDMGVPRGKSNGIP